MGAPSSYDIYQAERPVRMRRVPLTLISMALAGTLALVACGSDDKPSTDDTSATASSLTPEEVVVPDSVVTAGLQQLPTTIAAAIAAIGTPQADAKLEAIENEWFSFEGTVREKDTELYLAIEDQLTPLQRQIEAGDSAKATTTAETLNGLFDQYMAKYP